MFAPARATARSATASASSIRSRNGTVRTINAISWLTAVPATTWSWAAPGQHDELQIGSVGEERDRARDRLVDVEAP